MGYTSYSTESYTGYKNLTADKTREEIFKETSIHQTMEPNGMTARECRDSDIHPNSIPIIIALDVTGSMGYIPEDLIKNNLGKLVGGIINAGIPDPAICFIAVGDHISDNAPLQVGQFESGDQELIMWLERTWLEGCGGGSMEESYHTVWYLASKYTATDAWEKRKQKGILITIGDEMTHNHFTDSAVKSMFGPSVQADKFMSAEDLLTMASERWNVYHIHANDGSYSVKNSNGQRVLESWKKLLGQKVIVVNNHVDIADTIVKIVVDNVDQEIYPTSVDTSTGKYVNSGTTTEEEEML